MSGFMKSALNLFGIGKGEGISPAQTMELEEFLGELSRLAGFDLSFQKTEKEGVEGVVYEIAGADTEEFLGSSSEMLEALAHISMRFQRNKAGLSNEAPQEGQTALDLRISFDSGDFRQRKVQELKDLVSSKRQKVIDNSGKPAYINALGPAERKVIHTFVGDLGDVVSESIGSGYFKRVRIRMKDDRRPEAQQGGGQRPRRGGRDGGRDGGPRGNGPSRGPRSGGRNFSGGGNRGPRDNNNSNSEVNGNVVYNKPEADEVDDNIGNRLAPGEEPLFSFDNHDSDKK
jgi:predicted RNA-binding protein Jag